MTRHDDLQERSDLLQLIEMMKTRAGPSAVVGGDQSSKASETAQSIADAERRLAELNGLLAPDALSEP